VSGLRTVGLLLLLACGGKKERDDWQPIGTVQPRDAAVPIDAAVDTWALCETGLRDAMKVPANRRVASIIHACQPCGDWKPLLEWDKQQVDGGPTRAAIEQAMLACKGYCNPNAKQRFLGTLDAARGKGTRTPWRHLGEYCMAEVSAVPDARYLNAPFFALDRIARAASARPELVPLLDAIELALPAVSITGSGIDLAKSPTPAPEVAPIALTITAVELRVAQLPRAKLGKDGVAIVSKGEPYPGTLVKSAKELDAAITALGGSTAITLFAPHGMTATRLLDALAITGAREVTLAVAANGGLPGWPVAGTIPVTLTATSGPKALKLVLDDNPDPAIVDARARKAELVKGPIAIQLGPKATVAALAKLVGALHFFQIKTVAIRRP
jgi:hypothetical protein